MELSKILKDYKNKFGVNNEYIANKLNVSKSSVSRWVNGEVKTLQEDTKVALSNLLGKDVEELLSNNIINYSKPILGSVKAGYNLYAEENLLGYEDVSSSEQSKGDYFLKVVGTSMEDAHIHDGDLAYIKSCSAVSSGEIAVILIENSEVTIKRIIKKANMLILEAANSNVETRFYTEQEVKELPVQIIGKVIYSKTCF
ncbi:MAG: XRE family transcriptional regulator [Erysipelotrichaceae bacterium]